MILLATVSLLSAIARAQSIETLEGFIWPDIDFKNVQRLPYGHLHKNKPRYGKYDWKVVETPHFQIYTYGGDERLTNLYIEDSEAIYREFSAKMNMNRFTEKIRVVIFNSSRDFEEANIIWGLVPKGLGGQTEMIKWKRVVVAFRDSPEGFRRLLRHELTHRYQGEFLGLTLMNFLFRDVPLWFSEGSAEHYAHPWDPRGEFLMRDAYLNNYLAHVHRPSAWYTSLVYKQGEYMLHFIAEEYKHRGEVIAMILKDSVEMKFEEAFKKNTGDTLEEFDKKLFRHIEKQYSPLRAKVDIADEAKSVGDGTLLAARDQFFITRKTVGGRETLYLNWTNGTITKSKKLVSGGHLSSVDMRGFEIELSPEFGFQEHGASFASSTTLVYAMDVGGHDEIVVQHFAFNSEKKKLKLKKQKKYQIPGVREVQYPVMLNNHEIAFVGRSNTAFAELYVADLKSGSVRKLTDTQRTYRCLTYSKSRNALITSVENEKTNSYDLASYDLGSGSFTYLTHTEENEFSAIASDDGEQILYVSDKGLVHNIHRFHLSTNKDETLTDAKQGVFRPQWFSDGLAFSWISRGEVAVKVAPLPQEGSRISRAVQVSSSPIAWDLPEVQALMKKIPHVESMTLFDVVISSDKKSAIFCENRNLSMEQLNKKDPEIRFHFVNVSSESATSFTVSELKKMKHYGAVEILPGTNVLLQKKTVYREKVEQFTDRQNRNIETEVTYKESFIYDWSSGTMHDVDTEISSEYEGSNRSMTQMSPDRRYLIWSDKEKNRITVYDILTKKKEKVDHKFYEIQKAVFVSNTKLMVLDKKWELSLALIDITSNTTRTWDSHITEKIEFQKSASWFPVENGEKNFIIVPIENRELKIFLFDTTASTVTLVASEIPLVKKAEVRGSDLVLTIANEYGLDRTLVISSSGTMKKSDEQFAHSVVHSTAQIQLQQYVSPKPWNVQTSVPSRIRKISKMPKVMHAYGVAGAVFGNGGFGTFLTLQMVAFDEISNRALATEIYLQNTTYGIANIQYYDMEHGRSYLLDYWNFDGRRQKLDLGISQNIFLHEFLNWDVTFKQQQVRNQRDAGTTEWWRSNIGTTFSVDTTIWDCEANYWACHGPHSGAAVFTGVEAAVDHKRGFQAFDANLDARYHIPFTDRSGLALRAIGGRSFGPTPTTFIWGGNGTMRGIPLFSEAGNAYAMQTTELRFPILNAAGALFSGPVGEAFAPLTIYMDIRGGVYHDIGDMWYVHTPRFSGHQGMNIQKSAGYFVNVPTALGLTLRFNKGFYGRKDWNFWLGYNW
jgi:hypothetical protein